MRSAVVRSAECEVRGSEFGVRSAEFKQSVQYGSGSDRLKKRFTLLATQMAALAKQATTVECGRYRSRTVPSGS